MNTETQNQKDHWVRAMTRELLIQDHSSLSEKIGKIEIAKSLAQTTYEHTSPTPNDQSD